MRPRPDGGRAGARGAIIVVKNGFLQSKKKVRGVSRPAFNNSLPRKSRVPVRYADVGGTSAADTGRAGRNSRTIR